MRALRLIGVPRLDRIRNVKIRGRLRLEEVLDLVKGRKQRWKQRLEEMSDSKLMNTVFGGEIVG